ncbi:MAG: TVP38/TMEM64 family protein [Pseudanabaenaceae cyanobacterium bins.68]|nr:TVP38/TMEM64 family protein [Pseudanabaenaceae cyanobacterium bins.68]
MLKSLSHNPTIWFSLLTLVGGGWLFSQFCSAAQLHQWVEGAGYWGYGLFVVAYIIATLLVLPSTAFNLAGGVLFGNGWGLVITSGAAVLSAIIAFGLARWLGREQLQRFAPQIKTEDRASFLDRHLRSNGILYIAALRILPLIPFTIVSFTAGLSSVRFRDYLLGTIIGAPLGFAPFIFFGNSGWQLLS